MESGYEFEVRSDGTQAVVVARGEIDASAHEDFVAALTGASTARLIAIDLAGVSFMDSGGISALVRAAHTAQVEGGTIEVRNAQAMVRRLLQLTGVDQLVDVTPSAADAG
jgi:anti-anti-sigma factor